MSEEAIKRRQSRAKLKAIDILRQAGYDIIRSDNETVCVIGARNAELRVVRICVGTVTDRDIKVIRTMRFLRDSHVSREAWCFDGKDFTIQEIPVN